MQPAWSLDVLFVPAVNVVTRRVFVAQDVPLSRIPPLEADRSAAASGVAAQPPDRVATAARIAAPSNPARSAMIATIANISISVKEPILILVSLFISTRRSSRRRT
jgi:hypothetical protein